MTYKKQILEQLLFSPRGNPVRFGLALDIINWIWANDVEIKETIVYVGDRNVVAIDWITDRRISNSSSIFTDVRNVITIRVCDWREYFPFDGTGISLIPLLVQNSTRNSSLQSILDCFS